MITLKIEINGKIYEVASQDVFGSKKIDKEDEKWAITMMQIQLCKMVGEDLVLGKYDIKITN
jgi:hypothetical protein